LKKFSLQNISPELLQFFREHLYQWTEANPRPMPWKGESDPYLIWLSEIILQQTRVNQGWPYFEKFKKAYPTVHDLANAPEDEVMKLWQGLGYYSRARNLHFTAKYISTELDGRFPETIEGLQQLKGVGAYTAAAIGSFAFNLPAAVVDGNVFRIFSRFLGISTATDTTEGKKLFTRVADTFLDREQSARYNQAIMDFGAMQCLPGQPDCQNCPLSGKCMAFKKGMVTSLPVKEKKLKKKTRFFNFLILSDGERVLIEKRTGKDIWKNLYQFPLWEADKLEETISEEIILNIIGQQEEGMEVSLKLRSMPFKQALTHQTIIAQFWEFDLKSVSDVELLPLKFIETKKLGNFAFPKVIDRYLNDNTLTLKLN
jgi:A/G-specific adenine glycosylase